MTEFVHMELNTSDPSAAKAFYKSVFGWTYQDMPMPNGQAYTMATGASGSFGGLQANPMPDAPSHWLGYVGVKSLAATIAKVEKAGGQVVAQHEVPGNGTLAVFVDPQGAAFAAWEPTAPAAATKKSSKKKAAKKNAAKKKSAKKNAAKKKTGKKSAKKKTGKKSAKKKTGKKSAKKKSSQKR